MKTPIPTTNSTPKIFRYLSTLFNRFADFVASPPKPCSLKQREVRARFKRAIRYAKLMTNDDAGLLKYSHAASKQGIRGAFHAAFKDYMKNESSILNNWE